MRSLAAAAQPAENQNVGAFGGGWRLSEHARLTARDSEAVIVKGKGGEHGPAAEGALIITGEAGE
jgi:hypothetical protein